MSFRDLARNQAETKDIGASVDTTATERDRVRALVDSAQTSAGVNRKIFESIQNNRDVLTLGERGEVVLAVKQELNQWLRAHHKPELELTAVYDRTMRSAVIDFQRSVSIDRDGNVGPAIYKDGRRISGLHADGIFGPRSLFALHAKLGVTNQSFAEFTKTTDGIYNINQVQNDWQATDLPIKLSQRLSAKVEKAGLSEAFLERTAQIAAKYGRSAEDLLRVMSWETGGTFKTGRHNSSGTDTGLIGITEETARELGTSTAVLANMSREEQLDYVERYFDKRVRERGRPDSFTDLYCMVWRPASANAPDSQIIFAAGTRAARRFANAFDLDGDGNITKGEVGRKVRNA